MIQRFGITHVETVPITIICIYIYTGWAKSRVTATSFCYAHLEILRDVVVQQLRTKANFDELHFQQDGAPPRYARTVREYLHQTIPQRWVGRRGSIEWPPRSPELTPMSFFGGVVKNKVHERNPLTVNELKDYISDEFTEIDGDRNLCRTCVRVLWTDIMIVARMKVDILST